MLESFVIRAYLTCLIPDVEKVVLDGCLQLGDEPVHLFEVVSQEVGTMDEVGLGLLEFLSLRDAEEGLDAME